MNHDIGGLIAALIIVSIGYAVYHSIGLYLIKHVKTPKLSIVVAVIFAILFPSVSQQYPLSYQHLHRLRVKVYPISLVVLLYAAFVGLLIEPMEKNDARLTFIALIILPYLLSIWQTIKVSTALAYIQTIELLLSRRQENIAVANKLKKEANLHIHKLKKENRLEEKQLVQELNNILTENKRLKANIKQEESKLLQAERRKKNIHILIEYTQKGCEIGIDTNILMECDDEFFHYLKKSRMVVSKFVHHEWDKLKSAKHDEVRRKARIAMYRFEELQKEGNVRMISKQWDNRFLKKYTLIEKHSDDAIIADYLYEYKERNRNIFALSDDTGFRTSARGAGLPVLDIKL